MEQRFAIVFKSDEKNEGNNLSSLLGEWPAHQDRDGLIMDRAIEIRSQMAMIRDSLDHHAEEVVNEARRSTDWRIYFAHHPYLWAAGAFALGYLVIPKRTRPQVNIDGKELESVIREAAASAATPAKTTLTATLFGMLFPLLQGAALKGATALWEAKMSQNKNEQEESEVVSSSQPPRWPR